MGRTVRRRFCCVKSDQVRDGVARKFIRRTVRAQVVDHPQAKFSEADRSGGPFRQKRVFEFRGDLCTADGPPAKVTPVLLALTV